MTVDPYVYPDSNVLRNALDIHDAQELLRVEADLTRLRLARIAAAPLPGRYDLAHLQRFHRELFDGLYDWRASCAPSGTAFIPRLAHHLANVNALHPFRDGNGRAQRAFFSQLALTVGYHLRWQDTTPESNDNAAIAAMHGDEGPLRRLLDMITVPR